MNILSHNHKCLAVKRVITQLCGSQKAGLAILIHQFQPSLGNLT